MRIITLFMDSGLPFSGLSFADLTSAPLSPCFHPHSNCGFRRRCPLVFSIQGVLLSQYRPDRSQSPGSRRSAARSQSPQLGAFAYSAKSNPTRSFKPPLWPWSCLLRPPCGCTAGRILRRLPTADGAAPPASAPPPLRLVSSVFFRCRCFPFFLPPKPADHSPVLLFARC